MDIKQSRKWLKKTYNISVKASPTKDKDWKVKVIFKNNPDYNTTILGIKTCNDALSLGIDYSLHMIESINKLN